jgi:hypothetical protein
MTSPYSAISTIAIILLTYYIPADILMARQVSSLVEHRRQKNACIDAIRADPVTAETACAKAMP